MLNLKKDLQFLANICRNNPRSRLSLKWWWRCWCRHLLCPNQFLSRCPLFAWDRQDFPFCCRLRTVVGCQNSVRTEQPQNIGNSGTASVGIFTFLPDTSLDITPKRKAMDTLNASNTNALRYADLKNILTPWQSSMIHRDFLKSCQCQKIFKLTVQCINSPQRFPKSLENGMRWKISSIFRSKVKVTPKM